MKTKHIAVLFIIAAACTIAPVVLKKARTVPQKNNTVPACPVVQKSTAAVQSIQNQDTNSQHVITMTDQFYVTYINDIYMNADDYIGKTFRLQGAYTHYTYDFGEGKHTVDYVYRNGPGCCGNDGAMCGFEFLWKGPLPKENDWIEVTGVLKPYVDKNITFLRLTASSVKVMPVRGDINVYN
jgi:putative membrane protein